MKKYILFIMTIGALQVISCKKYLAEKPDGHLEIPSTLADFQALMDYYPVINVSEPSSGEVSADNYYLFTSDYLAMPEEINRNMYTWQKTGLFDPLSNEWAYVYKPVFSANAVLEGLNNIQVNPANSSDFNNIKGQALFARGKAFYSAAIVWASAYDQTDALSQLGVPIRLSTNFNINSVRGNLKDTYTQIIFDLTAATALLPVKPLQVLRPSKPAAYAMLARVYLAMRQYDKAGLYADSCLQLNSNLIDYNSLNSSANYPIQRFNVEVIQDSYLSGQVPVSHSKARIDTTLYASYSSNDLRKVIYFKSSTNGSHIFSGSYDGASVLFGGIATDEVYLMRAECNARAGKTIAAINDLNTLLNKRYKSGTFTGVTAATSNDALTIILQERRKELLLRGLRWMDIKRLNKEGANITLMRNVNGQIYNLPPNDLRYALPIPDDIIQITGMQQNPR